MEATWIGFHLWKAAATRARSLLVDHVREALGGLRLRAPSGFEVLMDKEEPPSAQARHHRPHHRRRPHRARMDEPRARGAGAVEPVARRRARLLPRQARREKAGIALAG